MARECAPKGVYRKRAFNIRRHPLSHARTRDSSPYFQRGSQGGGGGVRVKDNKKVKFKPSEVRTAVLGQRPLRLLKRIKRAHSSLPSFETLHPCRFQTCIHGFHRVACLNNYALIASPTESKSSAETKTVTIYSQLQASVPLSAQVHFCSVVPLSLCSTHFVIESVVPSSLFVIVNPLISPFFVMHAVAVHPFTLCSSYFASFKIATAAALRTARIFAFLVASSASFNDPTKIGTAIATRIAMIATTIKSSARVKPFLFFLFNIHFSF